MTDCEIISNPIPVKSTHVDDYAYVSAEDILTWIDDNVLEIINRENFTTVTISTKYGPRAFRVGGADSFHLAVLKAKAYKESV